MEGCERCTLSPSIDGHLSHISIFLLTKVITKSYFGRAISFLTVGVKWKVVKCTLSPSIDGHCLMSLSSAESYY